MTEPDDLDGRVSHLEEEVADIRDRLAHTRADAMAGRTLAAGADHDVSHVRAELRAHKSVLNALRETQIEFGRSLHVTQRDVRVLKDDVSVLKDDVGQLKVQVGDLDRRLVTVHDGVNKIVGLLERDADAGG